MHDPDTGRSGRPPWATAIAPAYDKFLPDTRNKGKFVVLFEDGSFTAYTMDEPSARTLLDAWSPASGPTDGTAAMTSALVDELAARAADGLHPVTLAEIKCQLSVLGYALDRRLDCRSTARIMTGPRAGKTYPSLSTGIKEADTGRSAFHCEARRDTNFRRLQALRGESGLFAVVRGAILDL